MPTIVQLEAEKQVKNAVCKAVDKTLKPALNKIVKEAESTMDGMMAKRLEQFKESLRHG